MGKAPRTRYNMLMKLMLVASSVLLGACAGNGREALDRYAECVNRAAKDTGLTISEQAFLARSCHSVYEIQTGRFDK